MVEGPDKPMHSIRSVAAFIWLLLGVILSSGVTGAGIGFLEGEVVARQRTRSEQMALAEGAASVGLSAGAILGMAVYLVLREKILIRGYFAGVALVFVVGLAVAFWTHNELVTSLANVLTAIASAAYLAAVGPDRSG
jgi:hypothetical protein